MKNRAFELVAMTVDSTTQRLLDVFDGAFAGSRIDLTTATDVDIQNGRNASAIVSIGSGERIHIKRLDGPGSESRYLRSTTFESWRQDRQFDFYTPTLLARSDEQRCLAFEYVHGAENVGSMLANNTVSGEVLASCMSAIASLHAHATSSTLDSSLPDSPPTRVEAVHLSYFENATFGELALWRLLQQDDAVADAVQTLAAAPFRTVPIHGDFRPDQILIAQEKLTILDWEEFRSGDPCRDIATFLGDIFYRTLRKLTASADEDTVRDHQLIDVGVNLIAEIRPTLVRCWMAYHREISPEEVDRIVKLMGWHLFDRALANSSVNGRLSPTDRALAGIGRNLLLGGGKFAQTLGLEQGNDFANRN